MPRRNHSHAAMAFRSPAACDNPYQNFPDEARRDWFRVENAADGADSTDVYIYDMIGGWFGVYADELIDQLKQIDTPNIALHINSPGGSVFEAVAIYNALLNHPANVNVQVDALAASAASFIAQAGDTITMNQGSMMMIHDASASSYENADGHRDTAGILDKLSDNIAAIYADSAGGDMQDWRETMKSEAWYTAQEAVDANLADKVGPGKAKKEATNKFDLSVFNYAGRSNAPSPFAVMNAAKEARMGAKNSADESKTDDTEEKETTDGTEPAKTEGAQEQAEKTAEELQKDGADDKSKTTVTNLAVGMMIDGKMETDPKKVQDHITALETFASDTEKANRKSFVEQLAADNKIAAPRIDKLTAYALGLTTEGFAAWKATWDDAPKDSTLAKGVGGSGTTNHSGEKTTSKKDEEISVAKEIVARHRKSGMKEEQLKATDSYKLLEANNAL